MSQQEGGFPSGLRSMAKLYHFQSISGESGRRVRVAVRVLRVGSSERIVQKPLPEANHCVSGGRNKHQRSGQDTLAESDRDRTLQ